MGHIEAFHIVDCGPQVQFRTGESTEEYAAVECARAVFPVLEAYAFEMSSLRVYFQGTVHCVRYICEEQAEQSVVQTEILGSYSVASRSAVISEAS